MDVTGFWVEGAHLVEPEKVSRPLYFALVATDFIVNAIADIV